MLKPGLAVGAANCNAHAEALRPAAIVGHPKPRKRLGSYYNPVDSHARHL